MGSWASSAAGSVGPTGGSVTRGSDGLSVRTAGTGKGCWASSSLDSAMYISSLTSSA